MKKKIIILSLFTSLFMVQGCSSLKGLTSSNTSAVTQENIASAVNVNEDIFAIGSAKIEESGSQVAKMKSRVAAREKLKENLVKESETIFKAYLLEVDFYSKKLSKQVMTDLGEYVSEEILSEAEEQNSWEEDNKVFVLMTVQKEKVPVIAKEVFLKHLNDIIDKFTSVKENIESIPAIN